MRGKKITGLLVCAGLGVGLFAGGYSAINSSSNAASAATAEKTSYTVEVSGKTSLDYFGGEQQFGEMGKFGRMKPFGNFGFGFGTELSEEQITALEVYKELSQEIHQKYKEQHEALINAFNTEIEEAYKTVLGESYAEMLAERNSLSDQYNGLVNGFYSSDQYVALKTELDGLISQLATLDKNSDEYQAIKEQINAVWGQISVLAGEVNSQISLIHLRSAELSKEIKALIEQNKAALNEAISPIAEQFKNETKLLQENLMQELELLRQTLGI